MDRIDENLPKYVDANARGDAQQAQNPLFNAYKNVLFRIDLLTAAGEIMSNSLEDRRRELKEQTDIQKKMERLSEAKAFAADDQEVEPEFVNEGEKTKGSSEESRTGGKHKKEKPEGHEVEVGAFEEEAPEAIEAASDSKSGLSSDEEGESEEIPNLFWEKASKALKEDEKQFIEKGAVPPELLEEPKFMKAKAVGESVDEFYAASKKGMAQRKSELKKAPLLQPGKAGKEPQTKGPQTAGAKMASTLSNIPPWQNNPGDYIVSLIDWLINDKVLPEAYAQLAALGKQADLNAAELKILDKIQSDMRDMGLKGKLTYGISTLLKYPSLIKKLEKQFSKLENMISYIKELEQYTVPPTLFSEAQQLSYAFLGKFGSGKSAIMGGHIPSMEKLFSEIYKDFKEYGTLGPIARLDSALDWLKSFNKYLHVSAFNSKGYPNPLYKDALNNMGPTGPWFAIQALTQSIGVGLDNVGVSLQTDIRLAMMGFQSKIEMASAILEAVAQMLKSLAQNMRTSG